MTLTYICLDLVNLCDVISQSAVSNWSHDINASCDWFKTTWQPLSKLCCIWVKNTKYKGFFNSPAFIIGPLSLSLTHPCDDSYTSVHCGKKTRECIWEWSSFVLIIRHQHNDCYSKYDEFKTPSQWLSLSVSWAERSVTSCHLHRCSDNRGLLQVSPSANVSNPGEKRSSRQLKTNTTLHQHQPQRSRPNHLKCIARIRVYCDDGWVFTSH